MFAVPHLGESGFPQLCGTKPRHRTKTTAAYCCRNANGRLFIDEYCVNRWRWEKSFRLFSRPQMAIVPGRLSQGGFAGEPS